jgi:hypothetical protein
MTETIEQAAESNKDLAYWRANAEEDYLTTPISVLRYISELESSQPNPHRIRTWHLRKLEWMLRDEEISYSRMVEILNEIAEGKHKERIEI